MPELLKLSNIGKKFADGNKTLELFANINLSVQSGEHLSLMGASGSGKSTLLNIIALLEPASDGEILFQNTDLIKASQRKKEVFRANQLGFVFQKHLLLPELNLVENVALPLARSHGYSKEVLSKAMDILEDMNLSDKAQAKVNTLSGGEAQRGAIARALIKSPELLLMDEPTGNLDEQLSESVMEQVLKLCTKHKSALLIVSHNPNIAKLANRRLILSRHQLEQVA